MEQYWTRYKGKFFILSLSSIISGGGRDIECCTLWRAVYVRVRILFVFYKLCLFIIQAAFVQYVVCVIFWLAICAIAWKLEELIWHVYKTMIEWVWKTEINLSITCKNSKNSWNAKSDVFFKETPNLSRIFLLSIKLNHFFPFFHAWIA